MLIFVWNLRQKWKMADKVQLTLLQLQEQIRSPLRKMAVNIGLKQRSVILKTIRRDTVTWSCWINRLSRSQSLRERRQLSGHHNTD